jgi:hypothetical protein
MVFDLSPHHFSLMRPTPNPPRKEQVVLVKVAHGRKSRSRMLKAAKDLPNGGLHLHIGVKNNGVGFGVTQSHGQDEFEGSTPCLVEDSPLQTGTQHKKLSLGHGALQAKEKSVVKGCRIIEPFFIQNQGVGERTNLQEMVPIAGVACQSGDFQSQDQPDLPESDFSHEPLETQAVDR